VLKAVKNNISIFAIHTALDNSITGVNDIICNQLGLKDKKILIPQKQTIRKLITYVPLAQAEELKLALFESGAGSLGNYESCSFSYRGTGTFKGNEQSQPVIGKPGQLEKADEMAISVTFKRHLESKVLKALFENHPYEEVAYELSTLDNLNQHIGMGMIGELPVPQKTTDFLKQLKQLMNTPLIRHSPIIKNTISRVAVLGGSGSFAIEAAIAAAADVFVSADFKYHDFYRAESKIVVADIGHYESEQFTKTFLTDYLSKKITNFAPALRGSRVVISKTNTNPVNYL
jgi:hypothetical protein